MSLRYFLDENGNIFLEQQIKSKNPVTNEYQMNWEKIPVISNTGNASDFIEKNKTSFFFFESMGKRMGSNKETLLVEIYSCLSVKSLVEIEDKTRIDFIGKNHFMLAMNIQSSIKLLTDMMTRFMIVNIDQYGNIKE